MRPKRGQGAREARACWWLERLTREECWEESAELLRAGRTFARRAKLKQGAELEARKAVGWWLGVGRRELRPCEKDTHFKQDFLRVRGVKGQEEDQMVRERRKVRARVPLIRRQGRF